VLAEIFARIPQLSPDASVSHRCMKHFTLTLSVAAAALLTLPSLSLADEKPAGEKPKRPEGGRPGGERGRMSPEERLKKMTETLGLTQEQQDKVKAIFEGSREEMAKLREVPEDQRREKFGEFMKAQNEKVLAVLTPEQQEKYKAVIAERAKEGGRRPGGDKPGEKKPEAK
jgi:Spy/CpxP family protein refolding chaperone